MDVDDWQEQTSTLSELASGEWRAKQNKKKGYFLLFAKVQLGQQYQGSRKANPSHSSLSVKDSTAEGLGSSSSRRPLSPDLYAGAPAPELLREMLPGEFCPAVNGIPSAREGGTAIAQGVQTWPPHPLRASIPCCEITHHLKSGRT